MKRGDLFRVYKGSKDDPKAHRVFLVVSRQELIDNTFSTVICAPVYSKYDGIATQVEVNQNEGLKHDSAIYCDALVSFHKSNLTNYMEDSLGSSYRSFLARVYVRKHDTKQ